MANLFCWRNCGVKGLENIRRGRCVNAQAFSWWKVSFCNNHNTLSLLTLLSPASAVRVIESVQSVWLHLLRGPCDLYIITTVWGHLVHHQETLIVHHNYWTLRHFDCAQRSLVVYNVALYRWSGAQCSLSEPWQTGKQDQFYNGYLDRWRKR